MVMQNLFFWGGGGGEGAGGEIIMVFSKVTNGTRFENVC